MVKIDGRCGHFVAPPGSILLLQEKAFLNGFVVIDISTGGLGLLPSRIREKNRTPGTYQSRFLIRESFSKSRCHDSRSGMADQKGKQGDAPTYTSDEGLVVFSFFALLTKPMEGFEPSTPALRKRCSAIELLRPVRGARRRRDGARAAEDMPMVGEISSRARLTGAWPLS